MNRTVRRWASWTALFLAVAAMLAIPPTTNSASPQPAGPSSTVWGSLLGAYAEVNRAEQSGVDPALISNMSSELNVALQQFLLGNLSANTAGGQSLLYQSAALSQAVQADALAQIAKRSQARVEYEFVIFATPLPMSFVAAFLLDRAYSRRLEHRDNQPSHRQTEDSATR